MAEKTAPKTDTQSVEVDQQAYRGNSLAPHCPPMGTNHTKDLVRRRRVRYQRKLTYHYHHSP